MKNQELSALLFEIAELQEMLSIEWKPIAFRKAARTIETLSESIESIYDRGGVDALQELPGIGEGIAKKIAEFIDTGKITELEELKKKVPKGVDELIQIPGLGPKRAMILAKKGIKTIKQLDEACSSGKIRELEGFGEKSEQDILKGIALFKQGSERKLLVQMLPIAGLLERRLKSIGAEAVVAGSLRRRKETVADIDVLTAGNSARIMNYFCSMPEVSRIIARGDTKSTVILKDNVQADVRVVEKKSLGAALQYFTGNKEHNIKLRQIAIGKGFKLNEYGLFNTKTDKFVAGKTEAEIYEKLGLGYIEPELREDMGELAAAEKDKLPELVSIKDIKGDLHMHTIWSDGADSPAEMINECEAMGYEYCAISDHSVSEHIANGMDADRLLKYIDELENAKSAIKVFKASEVSIKRDGSLDYPNRILEKLDLVIASVHSGFKIEEKEMTKRVLKALDNPFVNILGHPTGRIINYREPYAIDFDKVFEKAAERQVAVEANAFPNRLDLKDSYIKKAIEAGCTVVINTDSHALDHLKFMEFGVWQARRGWTSPEHVLNAYPLAKLEKFINR